MSSPSKKRQSQSCRWTEDDEGNWDTGCDQKHVLNDGTPYLNHYSFCCYCGKALKQTPRKDGV